MKAPEIRDAVGKGVQIVGTTLIFAVFALVPSDRWYCVGWIVAWLLTLAWYRFRRERFDHAEVWMYSGLWWAVLPCLAVLAAREVRNRRIARTKQRGAT